MKLTKKLRRVKFGDFPVEDIRYRYLTKTEDGEIVNCEIATKAPEISELLDADRLPVISAEQIMADMGIVRRHA